MKNYYDILELTPDASKVQIKDAFRRLAKRYHPDKNNGATQWSDYLKDVTEANQVLGDKIKKYEYDRALSEYKLTKIFNPYKHVEDEDYLIKRQEQQRLYKRKTTIKFATLAGFICLLIVFMFYLFPIHDNEWELAHATSNKLSIAEQTNQLSGVEDLFGKEESSNIIYANDVTSTSTSTEENEEPTGEKAGVINTNTANKIIAKAETIKPKTAVTLHNNKTLENKKEVVANVKLIEKTVKEIPVVTVVKKDVTTQKEPVAKVQKAASTITTVRSKPLQWNENLMAGILHKIEVQKLKYNNKTTCIQLAQSSSSNMSDAFSIADYLNKNGYAIAGRSIVSTRTKGAIVDAKSGCVNLIIGTF